MCGSSRALTKDHPREEHPCRRLSQTPGVRESRVRDGAAIWSNPRGRGGVRARGGAISRRTLGARLTEVLPDMARRARASRKKELFANNLKYVYAFALTAIYQITKQL